MSIIINYTKQQYIAKIDELQGYYNLLEQHLNRMTTLKTEMFNFWDDPDAQKAGYVLNTMINRVQFTMDQTSEMIIFYRNAVNKFTGVGVINDELLEKAFTMLGGMGGR